MNMRFLIAISILGVLPLVCVAGESRPFLDAAAVVARIKQENSPDFRVKYLPVESVLYNEQDILAKQLMAMVGDDRLDINVRIRAVDILGFLRTHEAIDVLLENIEIRPFLMSPKVFSHVWPCAGALIRIGTPASRASVKRLRKIDDARIRGVLVRIILEVEGYAVAKFLIDQQLNTVDKAEKSRLQKALLDLEELRPTEEEISSQTSERKPAEK